MIMKNVSFKQANGKSPQITGFERKEDPLKI